jgi:hypothetical protein
MASGQALTWQEMRNRAVAFTARWRDETRERAESQTFWNEFFRIFDIDRRRVAVFELLAGRHSTGGRGWVDVFWPGYVGAEQKSRGEDLAAAMDQLLDYLPSLPAEHLPRLLIVSDFATFIVHHLETGIRVEFSIDDLARELGVFAPMLDREAHAQVTEEEVNLRATELLADLHDALDDSGYGGHELRVLLVRLVFIMFADDTQIWETGLFYDYLMLRTSVDGHDLGPALVHLFQILNKDRAAREKALDEDLRRFEYINGGLFSEAIPIPACTRIMRERLLAACRFDWSAISPAIFGSLFQNVMQPAERRALGAHYTTEQNIRRTIDPLFLDDLHAELAACDTTPALERFRDTLSSLTFFDPACGCGNFLIIAYRQIRRLELECMKQLRDRQRTGRGQLVLDVRLESKVHVGQFYGIELEEFPARIAETAMYLMDHLANLELSAEFGQYYARFPITESAHIAVGVNALRIDWDTVLPAARCSYLFGNPPFVGKTLRSDAQVADMDAVFGGVPGTGVLDYVAAWYRQAADYIAGHPTRVAFVATNSIVQGEQVPALWPDLLSRGVIIDFAHRTFEWTSEARGRAHVHVVIIGFSDGGRAVRKTLVNYATLKAADGVAVTATTINPYLVDAAAPVVTRRRHALVPGPVCRFGNMPNDDQQLILEPAERDTLAASDPVAATYLRELIGAEEMINGLHRYCLWLVDADPADIRRSPALRSRVGAVRAYRLRSRRAATTALAATPALFAEIRQPDGRYLCLPRHTSQFREYIPLAFYEPVDIAHDSTLTVTGAGLYHFGVLSSTMFMTWVRTLAGRLKSDYRLSAEVVYNTFPWPDPTDAKIAKVEALAQTVLDVRSEHCDSTLADLYDATSMPADLARAHAALSRAVVGLWGQRQGKDELVRQQILFTRYDDLVAADVAPTGPRARAGTPGRTPKPGTLPPAVSTEDVTAGDSEGVETGR